MYLSTYEVWNNHHTRQNRIFNEHEITNSNLFTSNLIVFKLENYLDFNLCFGKLQSSHIIKFEPHICQHANKYELYFLNKKVEIMSGFHIFLLLCGQMIVTITIDHIIKLEISYIVLIRHGSCTPQKFSSMQKVDIYVKI